jgi:pantothenate kinase-related protein Tda10
MTKYKLPLHVKNYVKCELYNFYKNKILLKDLQKQKENEITTRTLLIATHKINMIENVINKLNKEEKELVEIIFFNKTNQVKAEIYYYISKDAYYNIMNKMLYLTALEFDLI